MSRRLTQPAGWLLAIAAMAAGQPAQKRLSFEVASVKENLIQDPGDPRYTGLADYVPRRSGNRVTMGNSQLGVIVAWAYHLTDSNYQLVAGPWAKSLWEESYDIEARSPGSASEDELRQMFQTLLKERFTLKVHRETRELAAYDLVVAKSGPKLTPAPSRADKVSVGLGGSSSWVQFIGNGELRLVGKGASMEELAVVLSGRMRAPVQDRTGLTGLFEYNVAFSSGVDASREPVLTTAIRGLGLNLAKNKGRFEVLVVDHVEKPSGN